ncbi:hypothetical protein SAMN00120144_0935 [Hymenobacter roseosalivarius DSM 11622]|uniref:Uncharacterized protein n=1 Tax=Hymenobacter roseosalivarius DSM 11622 TaxID=645990 RepID=A0A1W1V824_9BACT|nr:hypothetical protein SAMN00120144_0935 [Hymenobacter roseosalivarius DSM 11622]
MLYMLDLTYMFMISNCFKYKERLYTKTIDFIALSYLAYLF